MKTDPIQRRAAVRALARQLRRELAEKQAAERQAKAQRKTTRIATYKAEDCARGKEFSHRLGAEYARKTGAVQVWWGHKNPEAARAYQHAYHLANREKRLAQERERYRAKKAAKAKTP